jgi:sugar-specific transcriptional regulator TrmB
MEKLIVLLQRIGLSEPELKVYEYLFREGRSSVVGIGRALTLHRPHLYRILETLALRGLVSTVTEGKRKFFVAAPPERVSDLFASLSREMDEALPDLSREYRTSKDKPTITHYEGRSGVTSVFADLVASAKRGETFYRYSSEKDLAHTNSYLPRDYRKKRDEKKLERFVITAPRIGKGKKTRMERAMKYIPEGFDLFDQDIIELIYANKVAFIDLNTENGFVIDCAPLADFHKKLFRLLYQKL